MQDPMTRAVGLGTDHSPLPSFGGALASPPCEETLLGKGPSEFWATRAPLWPQSLGGILLLPQVPTGAD